LYAYLRLQEAGMHQIAIYGAGRHTRSLLEWGLPDHFALLGFIESSDGEGPHPALRATLSQRERGWG